MAPKLLVTFLSQEQVRFLRVSGLNRKKRELSQTLHGFFGDVVGDILAAAAGCGAAGFTSCWMVTMAAWS